MLFDYFNEFMDFGIDNYDEFKKWNKSNNSYRGRSSYRRRRGGW